MRNKFWPKWTTLFIQKIKAKLNVQFFILNILLNLSIKILHGIKIWLICKYKKKHYKSHYIQLTVYQIKKKDCLKADEKTLMLVPLFLKQLVWI